MANNGWLSKDVLPSKVEQGDRRVTIRFGVNETRWDTTVLWDLNRELLVDLGNKTIRVGSGCAQGCSASCNISILRQRRDRWLWFIRVSLS